jgi:UDP-3-O-[3-hydroxymyristoyl] N-acetylglucosamine deacetylase
MTLRLQQTLASAVEFCGVGVHTGRTVSGRIEPARADTGVCFVRTDVTDRDPEIPARADRVTETRLGTVIANAAGVCVSTVEHLMAAFSGLEVDNAVVFIDGPEAPIMDGSCEPFVRLIDQAGRRSMARPRRAIEILEPVVVCDGDKRAALLPADAFEVAFEIRFDDPAIGVQSLDLTLDETVFRRELAEARTFGFLHEVDALRAMGLARGGSMENVIVVDQGAVLNPEGLRRPDEFVRHKMLDAIGDLYLLGGPILGRYESCCGGHALNNALCRALLAAPSAWRIARSVRDLATAV